jgi:hypothetical protein
MKKRLLLLATAVAGFGFMVSAQDEEAEAFGIRVSGDFSSIYGFQSAVNELGGVTTAFMTPQTEEYDSHPTYVTKYDADGNDVWGQKIMVSSEPTITYTKVNDIMMMDRDGNAIVAVLSGKNSVAAGGSVGRENYNIFKVSPTGEELWGGEGVDLNRGGFDDSVLACVRMIQLTDGSYVTAYTHMANDGSAGDIRVDRISSDGKLIWDAPVVVDDANYNITYPYLVEAGDNQFILIFAKGSNQDLMARKMDFDGESVWGTDLRVYRGGFGVNPLWTILDVIPDGDGGAFVSWYDDRYVTNYEKSYVSHITTDGKLGFNSGIEGERLSYSEYMRGFGPAMYYDKDAKVLYAAWRETTTNQSYQSIRLQKLSMTGELLWNSEGILVDDIDGQAAYYSVRDAGEDNIAVFYMTNDTYSTVTGWVKFFNRETGEAVEEDAKAITDGDSTKSSMTVTPLIDGKYWYAVYYEQRRFEGDEDLSFSPTRIYMQRVDLESNGESSVRNVEVAASALSNATAEVWSLDGKRVAKQSVASFTGDYSALLRGVNRGAYIVKVSGRDSNGAVVTRSAKVMK